MKINMMLGIECLLNSGTEKFFVCEISSVGIGKILNVPNISLAIG